MNKKTSVAAVALVLAMAIAPAMAQPVPNPDFGSGLMGLEPDPPAVQAPDLNVVSESLNTILQIDLSGLQPGDEVLSGLGDANILTELTENGTLITSVISNEGIATMALPPLPNGEDTNLTMLVTPATLSVDRIGDNPVPLDGVGGLRDGTLVIWGLVEDLGPMGIAGAVADPPEIQAPATVESVAQQINLVTPLDPVMSLVFIDPEDNILIGTLEEHTSQVPVTETVHTTAADITSTLNSETLTGLDVNSVLSGLQGALQAVGSVDTTLLGTVLEDMGGSLKIVDLPIDDPKLILNPDTLELTMVDGALGKITAIPGEDKLVFDNDLVTALKNADSTELTSFVAITRIGNHTVPGVLQAHPSLGNYAELLKKTDALTKNGITTHMVPEGVSCKQQLDALSSVGTPGFCGTPNMPTIPTKGGKLAGLLANPELNPAMAGTKAAQLSGLSPPGIPGPGMPGGPAGPGGIATPFNLPMGSGVGKLTQFPVPTQQLGNGGALSYLMPSSGVAGLPAYQFPAWTLPGSGIGALPEIEAPNTDALKDVNCTNECLPSHELTVLDGIMEGFQSPALPTMSPVVPLDALTGILGTVTDAAGNGLTFLPVDLLNQLPIGLNAELQARVVGDVKSIFAGTGIPDATVQLQTSDVLKLAKVTSQHTSNNNGYIVAPVPALGTFHITVSKEGYQPVQGNGQAGAPGSTTGQEYTMYAAKEDGVLDDLKNNGLFWLVLLLGGALAAYYGANKYKQSRNGRSKRTRAKQGGR